MKPHETQQGDNTPLLRTLAHWASRPSLPLIPPRVRELAVSQVISHIAAVRAAAGHPLGAKLTTAFGSPSPAEPERTAAVLAALSSSLYMEDTFYAGHLSHSTVSVPLAFQEAARLDGRALLEAVIVANECAARITAATTLGRFRGQTAAQAHLSGAATARLLATGHCHENILCHAWALALSAPPWSMLPAYLGSDAKVLSAATPVRTALDAASAAVAGLRGLPELLEHPEGFLHTFAHAPIPEAVVAGLGERWHTETVSFKVHPAAVTVDAPIDCAAHLHRQLDDATQQITEIHVHAPSLVLEMDRHAARYLREGNSPIAALNMSLAYNVATALLTGAVTVEDLSGEAVHEPRRWRLARRVRLHHDEDLSRAAMLSTAPVGEALRQAGERARAWDPRLADAPVKRLLKDAGAPARTFEHASKNIGCRITVHLDDGRELTAERRNGLGAVGSSSWLRHRELVRRKLLRTGATEAGADALGHLEELSANELACVLREMWA
ncbi:MmgE/PrpD family protein [Streptomyces daliensis]